MCANICLASPITAGRTNVLSLEVKSLPKRMTPTLKVYLWLVFKALSAHSCCWSNNTVPSQIVSSPHQLHHRPAIDIKLTQLTPCTETQIPRCKLLHVFECSGHRSSRYRHADGPIKDTAQRCLDRDVAVGPKEIGPNPITVLVLNQVSFQQADTGCKTLSSGLYA